MVRIYEILAVYTNFSEYFLIHLLSIFLNFSLDMCHGKNSVESENKNGCLSIIVI